MKLCDQLVNLIRNRNETEFPPSRIGRPRKLDIADGIQQLFKLIRTGMQWREVQPNGVAPITLQSYIRNLHQKMAIKKNPLLFMHLKQSEMQNPLSKLFNGASTTAWQLV